MRFFSGLAAMGPIFNEETVKGSGGKEFWKT
jgi:hypothetical protein